MRKKVLAFSMFVFLFTPSFQVFAEEGGIVSESGVEQLENNVPAGDGSVEGAKKIDASIEEDKVKMEQDQKEIEAKMEQDRKEMEIKMEQDRKEMEIKMEQDRKEMETKMEQDRKKMEECEKRANNERTVCMDGPDALIGNTVDVADGEIKNNEAGEKVVVRESASSPVLGYLSAIVLGEFFLIGFLLYRELTRKNS